VCAEVFAGRWVDDLDGVGVYEDEDVGAAVAGSDSEVVHPAGAAQADVAVVVDGVCADSVGPGFRGAWWGGFEGRGVGVGGCLSVGAVDSLVVVDGPESVQLVL
jgi:hypothetical protein